MGNWRLRGSLRVIYMHAQHYYYCKPAIHKCVMLQIWESDMCIVCMDFFLFLY